MSLISFMFGNHTFSNHDTVDQARKWLESVSEAKFSNVEMTVIPCRDNIHREMDESTGQYRRRLLVCLAPTPAASPAKASP